MDDRTMLKIIIAVASLKAASVSSSVASFEGTLTLRNISSTVTVSVGAMIAANRKAEMNESPANCHRMMPPTLVAMTTPTVARTTAGLITALRSGARICIIASKISGGTTSPTKSPPWTSPLYTDLICKIASCNVFVTEIVPRDDKVESPEIPIPRKTRTSV